MENKLACTGKLCLNPCVHTGLTAGTCGQAMSGLSVSVGGHALAAKHKHSCVKHGWHTFYFLEKLVQRFAGRFRD